MQVKMDGISILTCIPDRFQAGVIRSSILICISEGRVVVSEAVLIQLSSWGWAQSCSKHVEDSNKHIIEVIVRQVGHLPELANTEFVWQLW
jgi:hypothetical protein